MLDKRTAPEGSKFVIKVDDEFMCTDCKTVDKKDRTINGKKITIHWCKREMCDNMVEIPPNPPKGKEKK